MQRHVGDAVVQIAATDVAVDARKPALLHRLARRAHARPDIRVEVAPPLVDRQRVTGGDDASRRRIADVKAQILDRRLTLRPGQLDA